MHKLTKITLCVAVVFLTITAIYTFMFFYLWGTNILLVINDHRGNVFRMWLTVGLASTVSLVIIALLIEQHYKEVK